MNRRIGPLRLILVGLALGSPGGHHRASAAEVEGGPPRLRARILDVDGLDWRDDLNRGLLMVDQRGPASVWTARPRTLGKLLGRAWAWREVDLADASPPRSINYVGRIDRVGDGPVDGATIIGFSPKLGQLPDGLDLKATGVRDDDGVAADVEIRDTQVIAWHAAGYAESVPAAGGGNWALMWSFPFVTWQSTTAISAQYQLPEVVESALAGRWTIPPGEALVLALGIHRGESATGRSVLRERLVVLDAGDLPEAEVAVGSASARRAPDRFLIWATVGCALVLPIAIVLGGWSARRVWRSGVKIAAA